MFQDAKIPFAMCEVSELLQIGLLILDGYLCTSQLNITIKVVAGQMCGLFAIHEEVCNWINIHFEAIVRFSLEVTVTLK